MRNLLLLSFFCLLISCNKEEVSKEFDSEKYPQKWQLIKMTGSFSNSQTTGSNMSWQETYEFRSDGTFTKSRDQRGTHSDVSGAFVTNTLADDNVVILTYPGDNDIIGSCYSNNSEMLILRSTTKIESTWQNCDGPGLEYKRIE